MLPARINGKIVTPDSFTDSLQKSRCKKTNEPLDVDTGISGDGWDGSGLQRSLLPALGSVAVQLRQCPVVVFQYSPALHTEHFDELAKLC